MTFAELTVLIKLPDKIFYSSTVTVIHPQFWGLDA